jgi:UDP-2-acetamido-2,6-beta-L-arabino-hexul-4-ose reductase
MKKVLITGAAGFIGKNTASTLRRDPQFEIMEADIDTPKGDLDNALQSCEAIIHLAGTNRPREDEDFEKGNVGSLASILDGIERRGRNPLIVLSSSTQALLDNPYGRSKKKAEDLLLSYSERTGTLARIFRLPGVFGKWCLPNYNSVVATFCHNIAKRLPIQISDANREIEIVHVDDVIATFLSVLSPRETVQGTGFADVQPTFRIKLGLLAEKLRAFHSCRDSLAQPSLEDPFDRRLFGTYMSYLPEDSLAYELPQKRDQRGALAEFLKLAGHGQIFISRTGPGITRGNHYHDLKVEKFVVLEGEAIIRLRHMVSGAVVEYPVTGHEMKVVDIPPGWTHSIENVGMGELIMLFWSSEVFDPARPDTYAAEVRG